LVSEIDDYASVRPAVSEILGLLPSRPVSQRVPTKAAYGRVSAEKVMARYDVPPLDTSHMDGFAVSFEDLADSERGLKILGELRPGEAFAGKLERGGAVRVSTGSRIPAGSDSVIPAEKATVRHGRLLPLGAVVPGQFVFKAGEDIRKGDVVVSRGTVVRAQEVGLLISLGIPYIDVYVRPKVAIVATGSELTDSLSEKGGRVRNSHVPVFVQMVSELGCDPVNLGIVPDSPSRIRSALTRALKDSDLILTTGGTSVGKLDLVGDAVSKFKPKAFYHGIRMDRGRVTGVAFAGKPIVMMPGPIQGAMNAFILFALPFIRKLSGNSQPELVVSLKLKTRWQARRRFPNFTKVVYVKMSREGAEPISAETESMSLLTRADGFIIVPEDKTVIEAGETVAVLLLPGFSFA
jgi:molybdopterin molybdotransferase